MELKAGLGKIIIDEEVLKMAKNKFLILSLSRMKVNEDTKLKSEFQGKSFYFCSAGCKTEFDKNPLKHSR